MTSDGDTATLLVANLNDGRKWATGWQELVSGDPQALLMAPEIWGLVFPSGGPRGAASSCVESGLHLAWYITLGWAEQPSRNNLVLSPNAVAQVWTLFSFFWLYIFVLNTMENEWGVITRYTKNNKHHIPYISRCCFSYRFLAIILLLVYLICPICGCTFMTEEIQVIFLIFTAISLPPQLKILYVLYLKVFYGGYF